MPAELSCAGGHFSALENAQSTSANNYLGRSDTSLYGSPGGVESERTPSNTGSGLLEALRVAWSFESVSRFALLGRAASCCSLLSLTFVILSAPFITYMTHGS